MRKSICKILVLGATFLCQPVSPSPTPATASRQKLVIGVDGGTESIRACCFDATNGKVVGNACAVPYPTHHPHPGWAEQDPSDWYENLGQAVRGAIKSLPKDVEICAICVDTTCCSVVVLDSDGKPLRRALLWMDARSAPQTKEIFSKCRGNPALSINSGGEGPLSAEWMTPKSLWIQQNEPKVWKAATTVCEYQDYINYKLTGVMCASSCNAATRWHWDGEECLKEPSPANEFPGRPVSMYETLGIPELAERLPRKCLPMGSLVGTLTVEAAQHLNLPQGLPVAQGGPDAFVGMIGLGCIHPGQLCLITGSSHLHCVVSSKPTTAPGTWGAYRGAPLPGVNFAEGGQSSTGSIIRWAKKLFGDDMEYKVLDDEAAAIPPGCDGLVALETYQGSRTPVTDPLARGALLGLTLSHTRAHVWRALMEAVCFGTRGCVQGLANAGHLCDEIVIAGGATRSPLWLQMHADVSGIPVVVCENIDAPLVGCAVLASVGAGVHKSVDDAVKSMVRTATRIEPDEMKAKVYSKLYDKVYSKVSPAVSPIVHAIAALRGGDVDKSRPLQMLNEEATGLCQGSFSCMMCLRGGDTTESDEEGRAKSLQPVVSPSLLACDWSDIRSEVRRCIAAGVSHLHIDVFDGVFLDSPYALTFGPRMVQAIRQSCNACIGNDSENLQRAVLDLHVCVERPARFVQPMADAGADRFIFQWEAMDDSLHPGEQNGGRLGAATQLAQQVKASGMKCGVSINPSTDVEDIYPLLETGLIDMVDVLAVEPGFGGQDFQVSALSKLRMLRRWRDERISSAKGAVPELKLMVDGGVNSQTASNVVNNGADILVAGTFLFQHPVSLEQGVRDLLSRY